MIEDITGEYPDAWKAACYNTIWFLATDIASPSVPRGPAYLIASRMAWGELLVWPRNRGRRNVS